MRYNVDLSRGSPTPALRAWNEVYNLVWIRSHGLRGTRVGVESFTNRYRSRDDANCFMVMWLRNLDRITKTLEEATQLNTLTFLDVGCGTGIPTLYAATRYEFADLRGFDFEAPLIEDARRNQEKFPKAGRRCTFDVGDASQLKLPKARYLLFLANPFGERVLEQFISNNLDILASTRSYIAMVNDHGIQNVMATSGVSLVHRNPTYNCSLLSVGDADG